MKASIIAKVPPTFEAVMTQTIFFATTTDAATPFLEGELVEESDGRALVQPTGDAPSLWLPRDAVFFKSPSAGEPPCPAAVRPPYPRAHRRPPIP